MRSDRAASVVGVSRASTTDGTVGLFVRCVAAARASAERGALTGQQVPAEAGAGQRGEQLHPPAGRARRDRHPPAALGTGVERVEPDGPAGAQRHRAHTPGLRQVAVLTLGIDHPGPAAEDGLAPQEAS